MLKSFKKKIRLFENIRILWNSGEKPEFLEKCYVKTVNNPKNS